MQLRGGRGVPAVSGAVGSGRPSAGTAGTIGRCLCKCVCKRMDCMRTHACSLAVCVWGGGGVRDGHQQLHRCLGVLLGELCLVYVQ